MFKQNSHFVFHAERLVFFAGGAEHQEVKKEVKEGGEAQSLDREKLEQQARSRGADIVEGAVKLNEDEGARERQESHDKLEQKLQKLVYEELKDFSPKNDREARDCASRIQGIVENNTTLEEVLAAHRQNGMGDSMTVFENDDWGFQVYIKGSKWSMQWGYKHPGNPPE